MSENIFCYTLHCTLGVPIQYSQIKNLLQILLKCSLHSEVNLGTSLHYSPRSVFSDSREFSEAECDRERALDLEVQRVMENNDSKTVEKDELTSLLAR